MRYISIGKFHSSYASGKNSLSDIYYRMYKYKMCVWLFEVMTLLSNAPTLTKGGQNMLNIINMLIIYKNQIHINIKITVLLLENT